MGAFVPRTLGAAFSTSAGAPERSPSGVRVETARSCLRASSSAVSAPAGRLYPSERGCEAVPPFPRSSRTIARRPAFSFAFLVGSHRLLAYLCKHQAVWGRGTREERMPGDDAPREYIEYFKPLNLVLGARLGSGASGNVYRATQTRLGREVAIKFFDHPGVRDDNVSKKRFEREAKLLAKAQHPSIPFVLSFGTMPAGTGEAIPYIVMQFIDGYRMDSIIHKGQHSPSAAFSYAKQILSALSCVHQNNIVHRDVKPENVIVDRSGHCYLIDFSIGVSLSATPGFTRVTGDNKTPGTWFYAPPEQLAGREADHRSDIFSTGLVIFELLTGRRVARPELSESELSQIPPVPRELLRKACHPDPDSRFQSADDFRVELGRLEHAGIGRGEPRDALCLKLSCRGTQWDRNGYYSGPHIEEGTTKSFCQYSGSSLTFPCTKCGAPFNNSQYCADCGNKHYELPWCEKCGSLLRKQDRYKDTGTEGCSSCPSDDDIPF